MNNEIEKLVERLNELYDKIERLEYRIVEIENRLNSLDGVDSAIKSLISNIRYN